MPRILVVDDSADARYLLRTILTHAGHEVVEAANGAEGLEIARAGGVDLVISDGLMPVMDGFRLCLEMRRDPELSALPFVFHTASFTHPDDVRLASSIGAYAYLLKPAESAEIIRTVKGALSSDRAAREALVDERLVSILERYSGRIEEKLDEKVADLDETRALRDSYHALLDHLPLHIVTLDTKGDPDFTNNTAVAFIGKAKTSALLDAIHPDDMQALTDLIESLIADPRPVQTSIRIRRHDGEYRVFELTARPYSSPGGTHLGFVLAGIDISRQEQQKELLLHAAEYDPLTDLPTRHVFDRRFDEILRNVNKGANCALLFVGSDDLKNINDRYGFDVGDATVANLAHVIVGAVRPTDFVARLCATEFVVLAEGLGWEQADALADQVRASVSAAALVPAAPDRHLSVSISVSVIPEVQPPRTAGVAPDTTHNHAEDSEARLLEALQGAPALSFIPVYSLADRRLARCSVRYAYAMEERLIAGDELALGAAKHGVARRIGARIVELTLGHAQANDVSCSVQLSLANVLDPTIFERAEIAAEQLAVNPSRLMFEITGCASGGIRPPASWLQAAHRSPIRLVHACADLSVLGTDGTPILDADEIEIPVGAVLDENGDPHPTAKRLITKWRNAGITVTVAEVSDPAALDRLASLGISQASGDALSPVASDLADVPRIARLKG